MVIWVNRQQGAQWTFYDLLILSVALPFFCFIFLCSAWKKKSEMRTNLGTVGNSYGNFGESWFRVIIFTCATCCSFRLISPLYVVGIWRYILCRCEVLANLFFYHLWRLCITVLKRRLHLDLVAGYGIIFAEAERRDFYFHFLVVQIVHPLQQLLAACVSLS